MNPEANEDHERELTADLEASPVPGMALEDLDEMCALLNAVDVKLASLRAVCLAAFPGIRV